jgi:flagellar biosynthesis protein
MIIKNHAKKAIALKYENEIENAPKLVAKGNGLVAEEIVDNAIKHDIHIHEDPALVELLSNLEIHQQIPEELYEAVAEIFAFIYKLDRDL